jgi:hypothetical protein
MPEQYKEKGADRSRRPSQGRKKELALTLFHTGHGLFGLSL